MHRISKSFVALAAHLLLAGAISASPALAEAPAGPAGLAFYTPPSPLPSGERGSVIWSRAVDGTMALPGAARNTLVLYRSTAAAGGSVAVSGTVSVPPGSPPAGGWPVISWTHGTTGLAPPCGPSRDDANGPEHPYIQAIQALLDRFVRAGYAVVATDYEGLGAIGAHPFLQGVPNGQNALDMLTAARSLEPNLGTRFVVMGHSQGGQADLFTASEAATYLPAFQLLGNLAFAPGSHIAHRLAIVQASSKVELALPYVLYTLQSYARNHPEIDLARILTPQALSHLPDLQEGCMTHALTQGYWSTAIAKDQFLPDAPMAPFLAVAARNEPGRLRIPVPTMVLQGLADVTVLPEDTEDMVRQLCAGGNLVDFRRYPGADHDGSMSSGAGDAHAWVAARFAGQPASGNCPPRG